MVLINNRQIILPRVAALGLPTMYQWPTTAEEGGFIGYGPRLERIYRDILSRQISKLLRGAKSTDAKTLGLKISYNLLSLADD